jgi:hypothetical protein
VTARTAAYDATARERVVLGRNSVRGAVALGVIGFAFVLFGIVMTPRQAYMSYLVAYAAVLGTVLGALMLVMMSYLVSARWYVVLRRLTEAVAGTLPILALLSIPILVGLSYLYPWAMPPQDVSRALQTEIAKKEAYLNVPFFVIRTIAYFAIWIVIAWLLRHWSVRQDREGGVKLTLWSRRLSAAGVPFMAIALTFASFDWLMSLTPAWWSTVYGVYYFAGAFVAGISLIALLAMLAARAGVLGGYVGDEHFGALGMLLLTFVIFWAYIAFSQLLIIWIGDIPAEAVWYITRLHGGWGQVGLALLIFHFAIPFLLLLSRDLKRSPRAMAAIAIMLLIMHYFDIYWLAMPVLHPDEMVIHWLDFASLAAVIGCTAAYGLWLFQRTPPVPVGDPFLEESVRYGTERVHD